METYMMRAKIEKEEEWLKWKIEIPVLNFPSDWNVKIIPPFSGAIVRFIILNIEGEQIVSVYLDCYDMLGYFGEPYWEIYPYGDDVYRVAMNDTKELLEKIKEIIAGTDKF